MNLLLGGILTTNELYSDYKDDFVIETYKDINLKEMTHYQELTDQLYHKYFKNIHLDIVVGHSLGGLLLLDMIDKKYSISVKKIIICETFLKTPPPPFRNIVYNNVSLEDDISDVMSKQNKRVNTNLLLSLRDLDVVKEASLIKRSIMFIYGMRDMLRKQFLEELSFVENSNLDVFGISKTSHFCLIEDVKAFKKIIQINNQP
ncbi:MAG: hypothetical protein K9L74_06590 [Candidatus Izimaplasma sp.]|nr:hypothetical protein [Candidatus Izimaplasma bacterium]